MGAVKYNWKSGDVYGLIMLTGKSFRDNKKRYVECLCECGDTVYKPLQTILKGSIRSCGKSICTSKVHGISFSKGDVYGQLTLTGNFRYDKRLMVEAVCDCGNVTWPMFERVSSGQTKSCGCLKKKHLGERSITHGLTDHPLYEVWSKMKGRCLNKNYPKYRLYGGRGVRVCSEWVSDFKSFYDWSLENGWQPGLELDKDKLSPTKTGVIYCPQYCSYLTHKENCENTSRSRIINFNGVDKTITEWCRVLNLPRRSTLRRIVDYGWSVEKAFNHK